MQAGNIGPIYKLLYIEIAVYVKKQHIIKGSWNSTCCLFHQLEVLSI